LERLRPEDIGLYLFLALAADQNGLSCRRLDRIQHAMPCFDRHALWDARRRLAELDLLEKQILRKAGGSVVERMGSLIER
jgi:hypothetical protein